MKSDKILFGAACLAMGYIINSTINQSQSEMPNPQRSTIRLSDSAYLKPLGKDTVCFSNAVKSDTLKLLQKVK